MRSPYRFDQWFEKMKLGMKQLLLPLIIFQFIRTILLPTTFDVIVLGILFLLFLTLIYGWI
ncbi:hypothetical protein L1765_01575 [Microaerobacter geothermalis]|uniref:hypothetical protein n=1 Tax=Microaerobacter geothermalis TaxID=674972 RepID=UPI001F160BD4|nr:hypothetical protein [Microaerobacter geothermalis]MCF6092682.1 hypothetical protein [Microaerobacter geothermalis]